jgi:hypothetical protein
MNWDALGSVAELVAAVAVIVSLLYVAAQVRHGIATAKATAYQEVYRDLRETLMGVANDPIPKLFRGERLNQEELERLPKILLLRMRAYENWWVQHREGILGDDIFEAYISHMTNTLGHSIAQKWWREQPVTFIPEFEQFVNQRLNL